MLNIVKKKKIKTKTNWKKKRIFDNINDFKSNTKKPQSENINKKDKKNKNINDFIERLYCWIFKKHVYYVKKSNCLKCNIKNYSIKKCINKKKIIKTKAKAFTNSKKLKN